MKEIIIDSKRQAELLGVLFAEYEILTTEQMTLVKQQMDKPSYFYNGDVNSLWSFYNHITFALKKSHPRNWMEDQRKLHWFLNMEFDLMNFQTVEDEVVEDQLALNYGQPDNQTNLLHQLADMEADQIDEDIRYDANVTEELAVELELAETTFMNAREIELKLELEADTFAMAQLSGVKAPEDIEIHIESDLEYFQRVAELEGEAEIVQYVDPAGNTFEAPIVKVNTLEPTPEEHVLFEQELLEEIIEEEALFDIAKIETVASFDDDWDLSLDTEDEVKDSGNYFL
jgi:hypothetical protein